jgi:peptide/nickel transport system substrate-binding protein
VQGQFLLLERSENFWEDWTPHLQQIIIREMSPLQQMIMLEQAEIDLAWNLQPEQIAALREHPEIYVYETPEFNIMYLGMNVGFAPLGSPEVRDAIRYAIDYDAIVSEILQHGAVKIQTCIPQGMFGYNPAMPYTLDRDRARDLLRQAGYPDGFAVELLCVPTHPWSAIAVKIQSDLAQIGVEVRLKFMTGIDVYSTYRAQEHQMVLAQWRSDYADPDDNAKTFAHSTSVEKDAKVLSLAWRNKYVNLETSKLVEQGAYELDREKRAAVYKQVTDIILDDGPFAILCSSLRQVGTRLEEFDVPPSFFMFDASTFK